MNVLHSIACLRSFEVLHALLITIWSAGSVFEIRFLKKLCLRIQETAESSGCEEEKLYGNFLSFILIQIIDGSRFSDSILRVSESRELE